MPIQYENKIKTFCALSPRPRIAVETGTYRGTMTLLLARHFEVVHTVEMSDALYSKLPRDGAVNVTWHRGDTRIILPKLCLEIEEPVLWFLDAHYFAGAGAARGGLPIWNELSAIANRPYADVVAVDDVHTFGKKRPPEYGEWRAVTPDSLLKALGRVDRHAVAGDMFMMWRKQCS